MKLYNSLHNEIEEFKTLEKHKVSMYVCGPTVYNYPHIGNARPIVVFDTLRRVFMALGYEVTMISNYTDVDDKIINKALDEGCSEQVISERFIEAYNADRAGLHALAPTHAPKVTQTMDQIIAFIEALVAQGFAYEVDGDVYFRVAQIEDYGCLSNQNIEDLVVGARIESNQSKENPLDFTLWKKTEVGVAWDSPWSKGRPGWHSECVVMINEAFPQHHIDIHGGGMDLKFPHHENEIAQSQALYQNKIANYWLHNGMINIDGEKMSKSLNNVVWVKDLLAEYGGNVIRWLLVSAHYRAPLNLSDETLASAKVECEKTLAAFKQASLPLALAQKEHTDIRHALFDKFLDFMKDDLNTPNAMSVVFEMNKLLNQTLRSKDVDLDALEILVNTQEEMLQILGIEPQRVRLDDALRTLYHAWVQAKADKDFAQADVLRAQLQEAGVL